MSQNSVPSSDIQSPAIGSDPTQSESIVGASTAWEATSDPSSGDYTHFEFDVVDANAASWSVIMGMTALADPIIDTGHELHITGRFNQTANAGTNGFAIQVDFYAAISTSPVLIKTLIGQLVNGVIVPSDLDALNSASFQTVAVGLTDLEVQAFRAAGGYSDCGVSIVCGAGFSPSPVGAHTAGIFDVAFFELEVPDPSGSPTLELTQSGGIVFDGSGADYTVQSGGLVFDGGGEGSFVINEFTQEGGLVFDGGGSDNYSTNEITQSGGIVFGGGGRTFYIIAPDISGIYVIVPNKRDDTWYDRDGGPAATIDVKIPDPFVSLAFLPEDD